MKRDVIIFQLAGIAVLRKVEVGDGRLWLALASVADLMPFIAHLPLNGQWIGLKCIRRLQAPTQRRQVEG